MELGKKRLSASTGIAKHSEDNWLAVSLKTAVFLHPGRALRFCVVSFVRSATAILQRKPIAI